MGITEHDRFYFDIPKEFIDFRNPELNQYVEYLENFKNRFDDERLSDDVVDSIYNEINKNRDIFDILKEYL